MKQSNLTRLTHTNMCLTSWEVFFILKERYINSNDLIDKELLTVMGTFTVTVCVASGKSLEHLWSQFLLCKMVMKILTLMSCQD